MNIKEKWENNEIVLRRKLERKTSTTQKTNIFLFLMTLLANGTLPFFLPLR